MSLNTRHIRKCVYVRADNVDGDGMELEDTVVSTAKHRTHHKRKGRNIIHPTTHQHPACMSSTDAAGIDGNEFQQKMN